MVVQKRSDSVSDSNQAEEYFAVDIRSWLSQFLDKRSGQKTPSDSDQAEEYFAVDVRCGASWFLDKRSGQNALCILVEGFAKFAVFDDKAKALDVQSVCVCAYIYVCMHAVFDDETKALDVQSVCVYVCVCAYMYVCMRFSMTR